jgi:hypothetical protein
MSFYYGSYANQEQRSFEGTEIKQRTSVDLFEGDFYNEDEPVHRGLSFNPQPQGFGAVATGDISDFVHTFGEAFNSSKEIPRGLLSRTLVLPGESAVELEVKGEQHGKTFLSSTSPTELAEAVVDYLTQMDAVLKMKPQKRAISAQICTNYQLLKLKVSFHVPKDAQDQVGMTIVRKSGDSLQFNNTVLGCESALRERRIALEIPVPSTPASFAPPSLDMFAPPMLAPFSAQEAPPPLWDAHPAGSLTPNQLLELPLLEVEPCTAEDLTPLLEMATSGMDSDMVEAAVQLCHMIDRETDAEVVIQVLLQQPDVMASLLEEPACVLAAPALLEKVVQRAGEQDGFNALDFVNVALKAMGSEKTILGRRKLAHCVDVVLSILSPPGSSTASGLLESVQALEESMEDATTKRYLHEATFSLRHALGC